MDDYIDSEPNSPGEANMVAYDEDNAADENDAYQRLNQIKMKAEFNKDDIIFWFNTFEMRLQEAGVKKQYTKKAQLVKVLPQYALDEVKAFVRLNEQESGDQAYKSLNDELTILD